MRGKPKLIKLRDKNGKLKSPDWYIQYYEGRSKRISTGCLIGSQDHEANLALAAFTLEREKPLAREPDKLMVAQALKDYWDEHAQYSAASDRGTYCEKRLNAHFTGYFVVQITQARINEYVRKCQERKESNGTIRRDLEHLRAAFNHEIREQRLLYAPKFKLPCAPAPKERVLSESEIKRLYKHCITPHVKNFVTLMLNTGQRPSAIQNLKWFQVDLKKGIIRFDLASKHGNKRARSIPINQELRVLLTKLKKEKQTEYVLEYKGKHAGNIKKAFARAALRAGLKDVNRYTLRHTWGTQKYLAGHSEKDISDIMGHTTVATTVKHYIKTDMDRLRSVVGSAQKVRKTKRGKK